jgi:hypothetical protein
LDIGSIIDTAARNRVVIVGSPPTLGRDLDLLIRATDRRSIEHARRKLRRPSDRLSQKHRDRMAEALRR